MHTLDMDLMTLSREAIMNHPAVSDWLKKGLATALERDPVDAAADAETLLILLRQHRDAALLAGEFIADPVAARQEDLWRTSDGP